MKIGDRVLFRVGNNDKGYKTGIYAVGTIMTNPYILTDRPSDYCNGKLTADIKIDFIDYNKPFISEEKCKEFIHCYISVHKIDEAYYNEINNIINNLK